MGYGELKLYILIGKISSFLMHSPYRGPVPCQDLKRQVGAQRPVAAPLRGNEVTVPGSDDLHEP